MKKRTSKAEAGTKKEIWCVDDDESTIHPIVGVEFGVLHGRSVFIPCFWARRSRGTSNGTWALGRKRCVIRVRVGGGRGRGARAEGKVSMADKDKKHRLRLVVKLPRRRSLPSPTTSTKVRSSIPAAPRAASLPDEDSPQPQSSVAAAAAAAAAAPPAATTTTTTAMPQKTVPSEETTAKIANTTTIKQRLTTPPKKRKFKALLEGDGVLVAEVRAHTH